MRKMTEGEKRLADALAHAIHRLNETSNSYEGTDFKGLREALADVTGEDFNTYIRDHGKRGK